MTHFNEKLIRIDDKNTLIEFLQQPTLGLAEGLTALLSSPVQFRLAAGHIVQAAIKGRLFQQLGKELKDLKKAGRIKEDYFATHNQQATLHDLLKFIDENPPGEEIFKAMKSIFFSTIKTEATAENEQIGYQLLQLCRKLESGDVLVLKACWDMYRQSPDKLHAELLGKNHTRDWCDLISTKTNVPSGLVNLHDKKLIELNLVTPRQFPDGSAINPIDCRLTSLGRLLCDHITAFS
jgi:hypothetical protein